MISIILFGGKHVCFFRNQSLKVVRYVLLDHGKLGLREVVNASGKMTILGVSTTSDHVQSAQIFGSTHFFEMDDLKRKTGRFVADLVGAEDAQIVASASSGIALSVAAIIGKGDDYHVYHPYSDRFQKREVILPKGHNVDYGTPVEVMVAMGGGKVIEAGYANACNPEHLSLEITDNTVGVLYIKSHHAVQKSMLSIEMAIKTAHDNKLPIIIDAAAEEDLKKYIRMGADLVIYSGAKAIEGPSSGVVFGKRKYIEWLRLHDKGIGRGMKIGKENILGLTQAIDDYLKKESETLDQQAIRIKSFIDGLNNIDGIQASIVKDSSGRDIYRASVKIDCSKTAEEVITELKNFNPAIYTREYQANIGIIEFDIRAINDSDMKKIITRVRQIIEGN